MTLRKHVGRRLTDEQEAFLVCGDLLSGDTLAEAFDGSLEAARKAWTLHRERLMIECRPGQRPWGYWAFERPDFKGEAEQPPLVAELSEGHYFLVVPSREWEVLERLGLLSDAELEWLDNWRATTLSRPHTVDRLGEVLPMTRGLYFPHRDSESNGHDTNGSNK